MSEIINFPNAEEVNTDTNVEMPDDTILNFAEILSDLEEAGAEQGFEEIALLLALDDEQFNIIAPFYLIEMEKSINNINDKMALSAALHVSGKSLKEVSAVYEQIAEQIDNDETANLSEPKRNFLKRMCAIVVNAINEVEGVAKRIIQIPIEMIHADAKMPAYANPGDAGMDVYALDDITVHPGETKLIPLGIKVAIPFGYELQVRPKSGRALKTKLRVANTPGTIDSGYRDEVCVIIENIEPAIKDLAYHFDDNGKVIIDSILHGASFTIGKGEKFAQLVLCEVPTAAFFEVDNIASIDGNRGGGFGSSGLK